MGEKHTVFLTRSPSNFHVHRYLRSTSLLYWRVKADRCMPHTNSCLTHSLSLNPCLGCRFQQHSIHTPITSASQQFLPRLTFYVSPAHGLHLATAYSQLVYLNIAHTLVYLRVSAPLCLLPKLFFISQNKNKKYQQLTFSELKYVSETVLSISMH